MKVLALVRCLHSGHKPVFHFLPNDKFKSVTKLFLLSSYKVSDTLKLILVLHIEWYTYNNTRLRNCHSMKKEMSGVYIYLFNVQNTGNTTYYTPKQLL